jgi:polysaccharide export outer membrane protein
MISILFLSNVLFSGCSTGNYSLESYAKKVPIMFDFDKKNSDGSVRYSDVNQGNIHSIFSSNKELNYIASNDIYRINSGDRLDISVFKIPELSKSTTVNSKGDISFPLIGKFHAKGLSQEEAEEKLARTLSIKYLQNPQVSIMVDNKVNNKVTLGGQVRNSGIFSLDKNITLLQSIALAGGLNDMSDPTRVILFRKSSAKTYLLNLQDIRSAKMRDPYIKADDHIVVAQSGTRSFIKDASTILGGLVTPLWGIF